jgi:hypothetical protein
MCEVVSESIPQHVSAVVLISPDATNESSLQLPFPDIEYEPPSAHQFRLQETYSKSLALDTPPRLRHDLPVVKIPPTADSFPAGHETDIGDILTLLP